MSRIRPAFYAPTGTRLGDLIALLHPPYTAWHLAYVAIGAALAPALDWTRLAGALLAFFLGTGIAAHALDERNGRPLGTKLGDRTLLALGVGGLMGALGVAIGGVWVISPWVMVWAGAGIALAAGYPLGWPPRLHTDVGFALAWGSFPVLVGYWAQTETIGAAAVVAAAAAAVLSLAQRRLSTPARFVRRSTTAASASLQTDDGRQEWSRRELLATWERPLQLLGWAVVLLAAGLLLRHV